MKILVTGSDGFIAKNLISELKNKGYQDFFFCNRNTTEEELSFFARECDVVYHLAGINRPKEEVEFQRGNVEFTDKLIQYLRQNEKEIKIIYSSSIQAIKDNPYGISKRKAEDALIEYASETNSSLAIYRLPNVFGKWCKPNYNSVVATFCYNISHDSSIRIDNPKAEIDLVYIDDVVQAFIDCMEESKTSGDRYMDVYDKYTVEVGKIADLITGFRKQRESLEIPKMDNPFEKKLYSTYLSYLDEKQFKYPLKMNIDQRGSFTEFLRMDESGQVSINICKPGIIKGNHWHHTKVEKFLVVKGNALIRFRHMVSNKIIEYIVSGEKLEVVDIPVGYTHSIQNIGTEDLVTVMWANEGFDKNKPDTFFEEV